MDICNATLDSNSASLSSVANTNSSNDIATIDRAPNDIDVTLSSKVDSKYTCLREAKTNNILLAGLRVGLRLSKLILFSSLCPRSIRRIGFEFIAHGLPIARDVSITKGEIGGVKCRHFTPNQDISSAAISRQQLSNNTKMLYVHGGGFEIGSSHSHASLTSQYAQKGGFPVTSIDYRLDASNAISDLKSCYAAMVEQDDKDLVIVGDSAGGCLALKLVHEILKDTSLRAPRCIGLLSAVTDLDLKSPSIRENEKIDPIVSEAWLRKGIKYFYNEGVKCGLQGTEDQFKRDLSAINHDYSGWPPVYIQAGTDEILLDDSINLAKKLNDQGVPVFLDIFKDIFHGFQLHPIPDGQEANQRMTDFLNDPEQWLNKEVG